MLPSLLDDIEHDSDSVGDVQPLLSPVPGERRRLSFDHEIKRHAKLFKSLNDDGEESEETKTPNRSRSLKLDFDKPRSDPVDESLSFSPMSPMIVLSSLTSQLSELCTYTKKQLNLNELNDMNNNNTSDCDECHADDKTTREIVHYIRSPTDGVCVPIYKTSTEPVYFDLNDNDSELSGANLIVSRLNERPPKNLAAHRWRFEKDFSKRNPRSSATKFHSRSGLPLSSSPVSRHIFALKPRASLS